MFNQAYAAGFGFMGFFPFCRMQVDLTMLYGHFCLVSVGSPDSHGSNQFAILPENLHAQASALLLLPLKPTASLFFKLF